MTFTYATDGLCHNSNRGTFNHECGKPALWIGTNASGWQCGFCDDCKEHGHESSKMVTWTPVHGMKFYDTRHAAQAKADIWNSAYQGAFTAKAWKVGSAFVVALTSPDENEPEPDGCGDWIVRYL